MSEDARPRAAIVIGQAYAFAPYTDMWFRWASEVRAHGMPDPMALEAEGWERVARHPMWPASWLMKWQGAGAPPEVTR